MKNKEKINLLLGIILGTIIVSLCSYIVINMFKEKTISKDKIEEVLENIEKNQIVESSYSNFAWDKNYKGTIICEDGYIYNFDMNGLTNNSNSKYGEIKVRNRKISKKDLKLIKEYILSIYPNYSKKNIGNDMGEKGIYVWKNNQKIILSAKGNVEINNNSENTKKLISLIKKYIKIFE